MLHKLHGNVKLNQKFEWKYLSNDTRLNRPIILDFFKPFPVIISIVSSKNKGICVCFQKAWYVYEYIFWGHFFIIELLFEVRIIRYDFQVLSLCTISGFF